MQTRISPRPTVEVLPRQSHDVLWARMDCPRLTDLTLLECTETDGRLLLTLDKDFWQLALQRPIPIKRCGVILFRVHPATPVNLEPVVTRVLRAEREWIGHVSIVTKDGVEMIPVRKP